MRCGRILVEGEAEEISDLPKPRSWQRNGKKSNPFSARGLDKFQSVYAELSARRKCVAKETGVPEAMVRFAYSKKGWTPLLVRAGETIGKTKVGRGNLRLLENNNGEKDGELIRKAQGNHINGESEGISISMLDESSHCLVMPWFFISRVFGLSAMSVRRSAIPAAAAMAVGGVQCMKKFILSGLLFSSLFFRNPGNPNPNQNGLSLEATAEKKDTEKVMKLTPRPGLNVNAIAPSTPLRSSVHPIEFLASASPRAVKPKKVNDKHNRHHRNKSKAKIFRAVSMDNRPIRPPRTQGSDSFYRRTRPAMVYDARAVATAMIVTLFCLAFYGRLSAVFFTSAWWYIVPIFCHHSERKDE